MMLREERREERTDEEINHSFIEQVTCAEFQDRHAHENSEEAPYNTITLLNDAVVYEPTYEHLEHTRNATFDSHEYAVTEC